MSVIERKDVAGIGIDSRVIRVVESQPLLDLNDIKMDSIGVSGTVDCTTVIADEVSCGRIYTNDPGDSVNPAVEIGDEGGLFSPITNAVSIATAGAERFRIQNAFSRFYNSELGLQYSIGNNNPTIRLKGSRAGPQESETVITQNSAGTSDKSLSMHNITSDLGTTDIAYKWLSSSGSQEHQVSARCQHLGVSGSVSVPTYSFQTAANAGLYYLNGLAFTHGSTQRMLISNSGVRIGASGSDIANVRFGSINYSTSIASNGTASTSSISLSGFTASPFVYITPFPNSGSGWWDRAAYCVTNLSSSSFQIGIANPPASSSTSGTVTIFWLAIGS